MNITNIYSNLITYTGIALTPGLVNSNVQLCSPFTHRVHQYALEALSQTEARQRLALLYFAKPVDRLIQAIAAPFFRVAEYIKETQTAYQENKALFTFQAVFSPIMIPLEFALGVIESIGLFTNGVVQIVAPYQTLYAICKGKEAASEYLDYRSSLVEKFNTTNYFRKKVYLPILSEVNEFPRPNVSFKDLMAKVKSANGTLITANGILVRVAPPAVSFPFMAATVVYHNLHHMIFRAVSIA